MSKPSKTALHLTAAPVYLAASAINNLITGLPAGTAYFIGIVLVTMFTGQLVQHQGSLTRAALPYLSIHADNFVALAHKGTAPRKYDKLVEAKETADSSLPLAA